MGIRLAACLALVATLCLYYSVYSFDRMHRAYRHIDHLVLYLQWANQAQFIGFYVAKDKNYYDDLDLEVKIEPRPTDLSIDWNVPRKVSDTADIDDAAHPEKYPKAFGVWTGDQVLREFASKEAPNIRAIGAVFNRSLVCFMVKDNSLIFGPKDFEGQKIGVYRNYDSDTILSWLLHKYGPKSQVPPAIGAQSAPEIHYLNRTETKDAVKQFEEDELPILAAYVINEPLKAEADGVPVRLIEPDHYNINYYSDTIIVNSDTLQKHPDLVDRFMEANERGWRYALTHPDDALAILANEDHSFKNNEAAMDQQRRMLSKIAYYMNAGSPMFRMDKGTWASMAKVLNIKTVKDCNPLCDFSVEDRVSAQYHH